MLPVSLHPPFVKQTLTPTKTVTGEFIDSEWLIINYPLHNILDTAIKNLNSELV
jgi:hypothetical protein